MADVNLRNLFKRYSEEVVAVNDFSLEIADKEFLVLVGPSGCGKSTTLRMVAGLEEITEGELYIGDRLVNEVPPKDRDIAMVFQNYALYPHMNVYQNMAFGLKLRKMKKKEIQHRVHEAARILDIEPLLARKPKELSGGQRQRVALGRAIVREPQAFLMDEPLSNLDAKLRVQMRGEITKLHRRLESTVIYVTHDQTEAMTMGDRIVVMKDGVIQQVATPDELYTHPRNLFVAGFIGSPAMNFLQGEIQQENGRLSVQIPKKDGGIHKLLLSEDQLAKMHQQGFADKKVVLGIRPEALHSTDLVSNETGLTAKVDWIENMGSEKYLYLSGLGEQPLIVRSPANVSASPGQYLSLEMELEKLHLFDEGTELAIF